MYQSALISTGLPMRGVTTQSPTFASIQVSCTPGSPARSRPSRVHVDAVARALAMCHRRSRAARDTAPRSERAIAGRVRRTRRPRGSTRASRRRCCTRAFRPASGKAVRQHAFARRTARTCAACSPRPRGGRWRASGPAARSSCRGPSRRTTDSRRSRCGPAPARRTMNWSAASMSWRTQSGAPAGCARRAAAAGGATRARRARRRHASQASSQGVLGWAAALRIRVTVSPAASSTANSPGTNKSSRSSSPRALSARGGNSNTSSGSR